jgi:hypothetical protein
LRLHTRVDPNLAARVRLEISGTTLWIPVLTRWVRGDAGEWTVGCAFDRPTFDKQLAIRSMLARNGV